MKTMYDKDKIIGYAVDNKHMIIGEITGEMPDKPYYLKTRRQRVRKYTVFALKVIALVILVAVLVILCLAYFGRWWQVTA